MLKPSSLSPSLHDTSKIQYDGEGKEHKGDVVEIILCALRGTKIYDALAIDRCSYNQYYVLRSS